MLDFLDGGLQGVIDVRPQLFDIANRNLPTIVEFTRRGMNQMAPLSRHALPYLRIQQSTTASGQFFSHTTHPEMSRSINDTPVNDTPVVTNCQDTRICNG